MNDCATLRANLADFFTRVSDADLAVVCSSLAVQLWIRGVSGSQALGQVALELEHRAQRASAPAAEGFPRSTRPPG